MTREEWRAARRRLALVAVGLVVAAVLISVVYAVVWSATAQASLAAGLGVIGMCLVIGGLVVYLGSGPIRKVAGSYSMNTPTDQRGAERLSLGLLCSGIAFSAAALLIG
jgi:hypothetical protein